MFLITLFSQITSTLPYFLPAQLGKTKGLEDAEKAAILQLELRRQDWQLGTIDALIAAVALRYDLVLLTTDRDFQAIPGLPQEN